MQLLLVASSKNLISVEFMSQIILNAHTPTVSFGVPVWQIEPRRQMLTQWTHWDEQADTFIFSSQPSLSTSQLLHEATEAGWVGCDVKGEVFHGMNGFWRRHTLEHRVDWYITKSDVAYFCNMNNKNMSSESPDAFFWCFHISAPK